MWNLVAAETREGQVFERLLTQARRAVEGARRPRLRRARRRDLRGPAPRPADRGGPLRRPAGGQGKARPGRRRRGRREAEGGAEGAGPADGDDERDRRRGDPPADGGGGGAQAAAALHPLVLPRGVPAARRPDREARAGPLRDHARARRDPQPRQDARRRHPVVPRYTRVTFEKALVAPRGQAQAQLLAPGHPLLDATVDLVLERYRPLLKQGAILVADADEPRSRARSSTSSTRSRTRASSPTGSARSSRSVCSSSS